jgi:hypothetical protein
MNFHRLKNLILNLLLGIFFSSIFLDFSVSAQELPVTTIGLNAPNDIYTLSGATAGNTPSYKVSFDTSVIPPNAEIISADIKFIQDVTASGFVKIIDLKSTESIYTFTLGESGAKQLTNFKDLISDWLVNPINNQGLLFQSYELQSNDEVSFMELKLVIKYQLLDTIKPSILSHEILETKEDEITINWTSDEDTRGQIFYGKTVNYSYNTSQTEQFGLDNLIILNNLAAGTTYHYKLIIEDRSGNIAETADGTFTTKNNVFSLGNYSDEETTDTLKGPHSLYVELENADQDFPAIRIKWQIKDTQGFDGFIVYKKTNAEDFEELVIIRGEQYEYLDDEVIFGNRYSYFVRSFRDRTVSEASPEDTVLVAKEGSVLGASTEDENQISSQKVMVISSIAITWMFILYLIYKKFQKKYLPERGLENVLKDPDFYKNKRY